MWQAWTSISPLGRPGTRHRQLMWCNENDYWENGETIVGSRRRRDTKISRTISTVRSFFAHNTSILMRDNLRVYCCALFCGNDQGPVALMMDKYRVTRCDDVQMIRVGPIVRASATRPKRGRYLQAPPGGLCKAAMPVPPVPDSICGVTFAHSMRAIARAPSLWT